MNSVQPEKIILQSSRNQLPLITATIALIVLCIWSSFEYPATVQMIPIGSIQLPLPLFAIFPIVCSIVIMRNLRNCRMILGPEYITYIEGLAAWRQKSIRMEYQHIKEIEIDQTLWQKLLGIGDIIVTAVATQLESAVKVRGVYNPRGIKDQIRARITGGKA